MTVTFDALLDAVADTLDEIPQLKVVEKYDALSEDFHDCPMAQVYWVRSETDALTQNDRNTFRAGGRVTEIAVAADVPCRQRGNIDDDMKATVDVLEAVQNKLEEQQTKPYFGLPAIKGFRWICEPAAWERGSSKYVGVKVLVYLRVF